MKKGLLIIILAVIQMHSFAQYNPAVHGVPEIEYNALVALYNSTNGGNWSYNTNWLSSTISVSKWYGIIVENGRVTRIRLGNFTIRGSLPEEFFSLTELKELEMMLAVLEGPFPTLIANFKKLEILDFLNCKFTGNFPMEILQLKNLSELSLKGEFNYGQMPDFSSLTNLKELNLNCNFTGDIPLSVCSMTNLTQLLLNDNNFTGKFPAEINNLTNLEWLYLGNNNFDPGPLPDLSGLKNLTIFSADNCNINGELPSWFFELNKLQIISLRWNKLTGVIPEQISKLSNLSTLWLSNNPFEPGPIPNLSNLQELFEISLDGCNLTGEFPYWLTQLPKLYRLSLTNNHLSSDISTFISDFKYIGELMLYNNLFSGEIPSEISNLTNLKHMYLYENNLTGKIPKELFSIPNLSSVYLDNNKFDSVDSISDEQIHLYLKFQNNRLEYDDLIPVILKNTWETEYSPQDTIGIKTYTAIYAGSNYLLDINSQYQGNLFQWFKNGTAINSSSENSSFLLENIDETDAGAYTCQVTNPQAPDLTLFSRPINISVVQCTAQSYNFDVSICEGESYENHVTPGIYTDSLVNLKGCDSIVRTSLNFYPRINETEEVTICHGESYFGWDRAGTYKRTLSSASGCDSIITTRLTLFPENKTTITRFADTLRCDRPYQKYFWYYNTQFVEEIDSFRLDIQRSGNYYVVGLDENGCLNQSETIYFSPTGIDEMEKGEGYFSIYPNPAKGNIKIKVNNSILPVNINISNVFGEVLLQISDYENEELQLDLSWLAKGFYIVMLSNNKIRQSQKICLE